MSRDPHSTMSTRRDQTILAIESSCDETAAAVVQGRRVLSSVVATQIGLHDRFGGVVPEIASRHHLECVDTVIADALIEAGMRPDDPDIDAVAVTCGPGLIGALLVGIAAASARAWSWNVPLLPVDHLMGHIASILLEDPELTPPMMTLLASGGHTMLVDVDTAWTVRLLGTTRDDAAGEAFDKAARLLGLGSPGGPRVSALAATGDPTMHPMTPAMVHHDSLDTSFAGLKTALALAVQSGAASHADLAAGFEHAAVKTLAAMVRKGVRRHGPGTSDNRQVVSVVGGVAANTHLRAELEAICNEAGVRMVCAPLQYCGDNAAMIGVAAGLDAGIQPIDPACISAFASSPLFRREPLMPTGVNR